MRLPRLSLIQRCGVRWSSGSAKPGWHVGKTQRWGPELADKYYVWDHPTYTGFLLWIRGCRPYVEKLAKDVYKTVHGVARPIWDPVRAWVVRHNPDARLQLIAFLSFYVTAQSITLALNRSYQKLMDLKYLQSLEEAKRLEEEGFWASDEEDRLQRVQMYAQNHARLTSLWKDALERATLERDDAEKGFQVLCDALMSPLASPDVTIARAAPLALPPVTWRFSMIPYATDDATTFPVPDHEQPYRAFALNFTYNNLAHDWGDYLQRKDNKSAAMRPSREMFTDVYIPPTNSGTHPLQIWGKHVEKGHVRLVEDEEITSRVLELEGDPIAGTFICCPAHPLKHLGIRLPFLTMIVKNLKEYFSFEIQVVDDQKVIRRFRASNYQPVTRCHPSICTMPMRLDDGWNHLQVDLRDWVRCAYGAVYAETSRVIVHANCRLRRIYFSDKLLQESELPAEFRIYKR